MDLLTKKRFLELSEKHEPHSVSTFIPTHKTSTDENVMKDKAALKNVLKQAREQLKEHELSEHEINKILQPASSFLEENYEFWNYLSKGLAIFLYGGKMEYYILPVNFPSFVYVSSELFLRPLIPFFNENARYYILNLSLNKVRLFELSRDYIEEIDISDKVPSGILDSVGSDYEEKTLQYRSGQGEQGRGMYHGQGAGSSTEKKQEIEEYFRDINKGLLEVIRETEIPLMLAGVDYLIPIYKKVNSYPNLFEDHLKGNFESTNLSELHELSWEKFKDYFNRSIEEKKSLYRERRGDNLASSIESEIIPAAVGGRVEALFIEENRNLWGRYIKEKHSIELDDQKRVDNVCLLNLAAVETFKKGGSVYLMEKENLPEDAGVANAIFRFER